jgi:hypothetical protein
MAYPNDVSRIAEGVASYSGSSKDITAPKAAAKKLIRRIIKLSKPGADAMAADTTAYTAADHEYVDAPMRVLGAWLNTQAACTAHGTNYATINVVKGDGAAGAAVVIATHATDTVTTDDLAAAVPKAMTLTTTLADTRLPIGAVLGFNITKAAAGVVVPILSISVLVEYEGVDAFGG